MWENQFPKLILSERTFFRTAFPVALQARPAKRNTTKLDTRIISE